MKSPTPFKAKEKARKLVIELVPISSKSTSPPRYQQIPFHRKIFLSLTCCDSNAFFIRVSSGFVRTSAYCFVVGSSAKCIISTFWSYTSILAAKVFALFINWTISVSFTFSFATFFWIAKVVWFASACTENPVIVVICIGSTRIRIAWIFLNEFLRFFWIFQDFLEVKLNV